MKIAVHGQNHKGSTYHMGRILAEKLMSEADIAEFFLPRDLPHFCLGCYSCIEDETKCPFWNEKKAILDAMEQADLFIFTSPNYCLAPSGAMKSFLDLLVAADTIPQVFDAIKAQYWLTLDYFHLESIGELCVGGVEEKGAIVGNEALAQAEKLGGSL